MWGIGWVQLGRLIEEPEKTEEHIPDIAENPQLMKELGIAYEKRGEEGSCL